MASWICSASSRVGATIRARTLPRLPFIKRFKIGSTKTAVLPVPVWASPMTSRPSRTVGMAWVWMGVGVV